MTVWALLSLPLTLAACMQEPEPAIGLANPASAYCESIGGHLHIEEEASGQVGYCHLPDDRIV